MQNKPRLSYPVSVLVLVLLGSAYLYLSVLTPARFGFFHDDGVYVVMAKALATDQGYRIISLPDEPTQTKYPPFYPLLLSLVWRVLPEFPENLQPLMMVSIAATITFLALVWRYLTTQKYLSEGTALIVVGLVAVNWRTIILATNIYSDMTYAGLSVAALWLAEGREGGRGNWAVEVVLGVLGGLAFLTRVSGVTLLVSIVLYYVIRRQHGKALLHISVAGSFVLAWVGWSLMNRVTADSVIAPFYTSYLADFAERVSNPADLLSVIATNSFMLIMVSIPLVSLGLTYVQAQNYLAGALFVIVITFLLTAIGFAKEVVTRLRLLHVYLISYLAFHVFWPYSTYDRFLVPILPFLLVFLTREVQVILAGLGNSLRATAKLSQKLSCIFMGVVVSGLALVGSYGYISGLYKSFASREIYARRVLADSQAIEWIKAHTASSDVLLGYRDPTYYLYTGRKAIRSFWIKDRFSTRGRDLGLEKVVFRIISESGGRYLILTSSDFELEIQPLLVRKEFIDLLRRNPQLFVPVFECGKDCSIYRINPGPS